MSSRCFFVVFFWLFSSSALAQQNRLEEALLVSIPVSLNAASEQEGRAKAEHAALRTTFAEVLRRFVLNESRAEALAQGLSERQIRALSSTLLIESTDFENGVFTAQASVRFNLEKLFARLNKEGLRVSYSVAPAFLLIPVYEENGKKELWAPQNLWLGVWKTESFETGWLVPITPIEGSAAERIKILDTIGGLESMQAALLTEQYGAQGIAVLTATLESETAESETAESETAESETIEHKTTESGEETSAESLLTLKVGGRLKQQGFPLELPPFVLEASVENTGQSRAEILADLLSQARTETLYRLTSLWKEQTAHTAKRNKLRIIAELRSREEWQSIEKRLSATPEIVEYGLRSLSAQQAHVVASHYGSTTLLKAVLERQGLAVQIMGNAMLTIAVDENKRLAP